MLGRPERLGKKRVKRGLMRAASNTSSQEAASNASSAIETQARGSPQSQSIPAATKKKESGTA